MNNLTRELFSVGCLEHYVAFIITSLPSLWFHPGTINIGVFVIFLPVATALRVATNKCEWFSLTLPYRGRFCIGEDAVTRNLLPHQCRHICLQSVNCKAYNYNCTEKTCTRFILACPQVYSDPIMECAALREIPINQCYEWVSCIRYQDDPQTQF